MGPTYIFCRISMESLFHLSRDLETAFLSEGQGEIDEWCVSAIFAILTKHHVSWSKRRLFKENGRKPTFVRWGARIQIENRGTSKQLEGGTEVGIQASVFQRRSEKGNSERFSPQGLWNSLCAAGFHSCLLRPVHDGRTLENFRLGKCLDRDSALYCLNCADNLLIFPEEHLSLVCLR